jgi:hypothetical protein
MINGDEVLAAVLSLREATEIGFRRLEGELASHSTQLAALQTRLDRFEANVLRRFDALDARLATVEGP